MKRSLQDLSSPPHMQVPRVVVGAWLGAGQVGMEEQAEQRGEGVLKKLLVKFFKDTFL